MAKNRTTHVLRCLYFPMWLTEKMLHGVITTAYGASHSVAMEEHVFEYLWKNNNNNNNNNNASNIKRLCLMPRPTGNR